MRILAVLLVTAALSVPAAVQTGQQIFTTETTETTFSEIEDATGIQYQHDAGKEGDAPGVCTDVDRDRELLATQGTMSAMLVEYDDEIDVFSVPLGEEFVGDRLRYDLIRSIGTELVDLGFDIVDADCGWSVFDPDADIYHPERKAPSEPFEPQVGHQTVDFEMDDFGCAESWKFQIKHAAGIFPDALYAQWSNGDYTYIPSDGRDPSQVAKYETTYNTEHTLTRLSAQMPMAWDGELTVLTGICGVEEWTVSPPSVGPDGGEFTVVEPGQYILIVDIERGIVEKATGTMAMRADGCHQFNACLIAFENVEYGNDLDYAL